MSDGAGAGTTFEVTVRNPGQNRVIEAVNVEHLTEYDNGLNLAGIGTNIQATSVNDGPEGITGIATTDDSGSDNHNANYGGSSYPKENAPPSSIPSGDTVVLQSGKEKIEFTVDTPYEYSSGDDFAARVTLQFDDGTSKTIDVLLTGGQDV